MIFSVFDTQVWEIFHEKQSSAYSQVFETRKQVQLQIYS